MCCFLKPLVVVHELDNNISLQDDKENPLTFMLEKYTNHFLLYTKIVHVTRTITYVTRTILHDCFVKDNIVTTYCTRLFHAFRKPTMILIFFLEKNNFKAMIKKFLLFIRIFFKYCPTYSEQDRCAGKAKNLLKRPNIKYLTTEKKSL